MVLDLYNKVILPSITYALPIWGGEGGGVLQISRALQPWRHYTVALRDIYNLPKDTPSTNVRQLAHWANLSDIYTVRLATLIFKINYQLASPCMEFITKSRSTTRNPRNANNLAIPFSNSYYMKNSIAYRVPSSGISSHRLQMV